ncbi:hypothetical protein E1263_38845 [Kribbella antibiotica]|uniref:Uncharacterized protein n=1 Tax=Kribbella antibiotica TaxID=190195 RepID=A0A4R4YPA9_9ACTN|nr:FxLYD domain-containing protein [Kribbella antibiotica]TDD45362.1 hypothetical protein E1263_38845 [Kribbella antibiotica]
MTQYPQQPAQSPQQQGPHFLPPQKKKHTVRNVLLVLLVLCFLGVGGCLAVVGMAGNELAKSVDTSTEKNAPRDVAVGKAFSIGKHETLAGWTVKNEAGMFAVSGKVKNVETTTSTAFLHFKFLSATGEVLGNVQCNSSDLEPGQTQALNCIPDGKFGKYVKVTAEATF